MGKIFDPLVILTLHKGHNIKAKQTIGDYFQRSLKKNDKHNPTPQKEKKIKTETN